MSIVYCSSLLFWVREAILYSNYRLKTGQLFVRKLNSNDKMLWLILIILILSILGINANMDVTTFSKLEVMFFIREDHFLFIKILYY